MCSACTWGGGVHRVLNFHARLHSAILSSVYMRLCVRARACVRVFVCLCGAEGRRGRGAGEGEG
jgi:hypothetical protein